jgi:prepilin-type N-terminal cleavage/methylation domain-containing protein
MLELGIFFRKDDGAFMRYPKTLRKEGFTLVELLLVIVLIAILMALVTLSGGSMIGSASAQTAARRLIRSVQSLRSAWYACYADTQVMLGVKGPGAGHTLSGSLIRDISVYSDRSLADEVARYGDISVDVGANGRVAIGFVGPWTLDSQANAAKNTMKTILNAQKDDYGVSFPEPGFGSESVFIRVR